MNLATFRVRYPEFRTAANELAQACLDEAAIETSSEEFGTAYDTAHGLLAAHKLARSPFGLMSRLDAASGDEGKKTTYEKQLNELRDAFIIGTSST